MLYFLARSLIVAVIVGSVFFFYGQVDDHLFIKALICLCSLFLFYWYDLYRMVQLFWRLFRSMRLYRRGRKEEAYRIFEWLLSRDLVVPLPRMALMRLTGDGIEQDINAARDFCERAVFNEYYECYYLLGILYFFQNSLKPAKDSTLLEVCRSGEERRKIMEDLCREKKSDKGNHPEKAVVLRGRFADIGTLPPDYRDAVFNLEMYFKFNYENEYHYGDAAALYGFCMMRGLGIKEPNPEKGREFLNTAKRLKSGLLPEIKHCLQEKREIQSFRLEY